MALLRSENEMLHKKLDQYEQAYGNNSDGDQNFYDDGGADQFEAQEWKQKYHEVL